MGGAGGERGRRNARQRLLSDRVGGRAASLSSLHAAHGPRARTPRRFFKGQPR